MDKQEDDDRDPPQSDSTDVGSACFRFVDSAHGQSKDVAVDYSRDILPILANNCFNCRPRTRRPGCGSTSAIMRSSALEGRQPIQPGKSAESELIRRILAEDEAGAYAAEQVQEDAYGDRKRTAGKMDRWRAPYKLHWAFATPTRPALPS